MKKILLTLVCLVGFAGGVFGQWERVALPKEFNNGYFQDLFGRGSFNLAYHKDTILITSLVDRSDQILYSTKKDTTWRRIKMPTVDYATYILLENRIAMNGSGIFYAVANAGPNIANTVDVYQTKNNGISWNKYTISTKPLRSIKMVNTGDNLFLLTYLEDGQLSQSFKFNGNSWELYDDFISNGKSQYYQIYNITKNRVIYSDTTRRDVFVSDLSTKQVLLKFSAFTKGNINGDDKDQCSAVDSLVVFTGVDSSLNRKIYVSKDLGKTWNKFNSIENSSVTSISIIKNSIHIGFTNKIIVSNDYGLSWQVLVDRIAFNADGLNSEQRLSGYLALDSINMIFCGKGLFTKRINENNWNFKYNLNGFSSIIKANSNLYWGLSNDSRYESVDKGKTWRLGSPIAPKKWLATNDGQVFNYENGSVHKFDFTTQKWIRNTLFPEYDYYRLNQDTVYIGQGTTKILYSKAPYTKWDISKVELTFKYPTKQTSLMTCSDGILYLYSEESNNTSSEYLVKILRYKLDGTELTPLLSQTGRYTLGLVVDKNKIWLNNGRDNILRYSIDYGNSFTNYKFPKEYAGSLFKVNDFLLSSYGTSSTNGNLTGKTGGIYMSADNGESWFLYSDGIVLNNEAFYPNLQKTDSIVFAVQDNALWRINIKDLALKSISGNVYFDANKNGIKDIGEKPVFGAQVSTIKSGGFTTTDSLGDYSFLIDLKETDTLKVTYDNRLGFSLPVFQLVAQSDTNRNFGLIVPANDLRINLTSVTPPRPGFPNTYGMTYKNVGSAVANGKISFVYAAKQSLVSALPAPTTNVNQTLTWNYANLQANESRDIKLTMKAAVDAPIRSQITNVATIDPLSIDTFKLDNVDSLVQSVVGSFDPNDKQVTFNNSKTAPTVIDNTTELIYTIRFQNTGNYPADFVKVTDTLSDKLDVSTLRVLAASHKYSVSVKNKNVLTFDYNPIFLPDSTSNEQDSHGFIKFAIKPKKTLTQAEVIKNTAHIFFDYNPAIITNTVETANQKASSFFTPSVKNPISVFPNPTNGQLAFKMDKHLNEEMSINIYALDGRLMLTKHQTAQPNNVINGEALHNGLYILQIKVGEDVMMGKFLIQK